MRFVKNILLSMVLSVLLLATAQAGVTVFPKVCKSDTAVDLTLYLTDTDASLDQLEVLYVHEDNTPKYADSALFTHLKPDSYSTETKTLLLKNVMLRGEGCHTLFVAQPVADRPPATWPTVGKTMVYTLKPDLFALHPYKGDFHAHSLESDGNCTSFSLYAFARRGGHDFMTLSDHRRFMTAFPAIEKVNKLESGLLCMPGEEFHSEGTPLHSVRVGGTSGVHDWVNAHQDEFKKLVEAKMNTIPRGELTKDEWEFVAKAEVMYDKARDLGAKLIIYCHPYWRPNDHYNAPTAYNDVMIDRHKYDAIECPNGVAFNQTMFVIADAMRLIKNGYTPSLVNVSDTHNAAKENFAANCTLVFTDELSLEKVCDAVRDGMCLAVVGKKEPKEKRLPLYIGANKRLVRFAYFLCSDYYDEHDRICKEQGEAMLKVLDGKGTPDDEKKIRDLRQQLQDYNNKFWAK